MKSIPLILLMTGVLAAMGMATAQAQSVQDYSDSGFYGAIGYANTSPKSNSGTVAGGLNSSVDNDAEPTLTLGYRFPLGLGVEAWLPVTRFEHRVRVGGTSAASFEDRPVLVTAQYHFLSEHAVQPFVGIGYGRAYVSDEHIGGPNGPLAGSSLDIQDASGLVGQVGVDMFASPHLFVRADAKYFDWKSDVSVAGVGAGQLQVNPWIYGISVGLKF